MARALAQPLMIDRADPVNGYALGSRRASHVMY